MTTLPRDVNHDTIQALRLKQNSAHKINVTNASLVRNVTAFDADTRVVSVFCNSPIYIEFGAGDVLVDGTGHYFPANMYYDFSISGGNDQHTHVAVLAVDADSTVYISEKN